MASATTARRLATGAAGAALALASVGAPLYCPPSCVEASDLYPLAVASGIILSGFLLGEALGIVPAIIEIILGLTAASAGVGVSPTLETLALLGSAFLMFAAGMEVDVELLSRHLVSSLLVGLASFAAPMAATMAVMLPLGYPPTQAALVAVGVSTTSVAVVYAILRSRGLLSREEGQVVLASAMVADVASIMAFIALAAETGRAMLAYFASLLVVPPLLRLIFRWLPEQSHEAEIRFVITIIVVVALFSEAAGVHAILYSFILGVALREALHTRPGLPEKLGGLVFGFLSPIFFVTAGLHVGGVELGPHLALVSLAILAASLPVKVAATRYALRSTIGIEDPGLSIVFGARLTVSTIIAYTGLLKGALSKELAAAIMITAVIATAVAGIAAGWATVEEGLETEEEALVAVD